jgi:hypothetical protein
VARPLSRPGIGAPCSGARPPSTTAPPPLSPQTKYPMQRGTLSTHGAPGRARSQTGSIDHVDTHTVARVAANPGLAHLEAALPPSLLARATCVSRAPRRAAHWRAIQLWPSSMARNRRAILGRAYPIDGGTTTTSYPQSGCPPLGAATSQPAPGTPIGRQSSGSSTTSPAHTTRISHTRRSAAHRRAIQTRRHHGHGLARHIRARVPHLWERPHRSDARRQGGIVASQPRIIHIPSHPQQSFSSTKAPSQPRASSATTTTTIEHGQHTWWPTRPPALSFRQG